MKPAINIERDGPNANIFSIIGKAHAAIMEEGFRALKECRNYMKDADLIVSNYTAKGTLMKRYALLSASYDDAIKIIEEYVTINWI